MSIYRCTECAGVDGTICHANTEGFCKKGSQSAKWEAVPEEEATDVELENILAVGLEDAERIVREEIRKNAKSAYNPSFFLIDAHAIDRIAAALKAHSFYAKPWGILLRRAE